MLRLMPDDWIVWIIPLAINFITLLLGLGTLLWRYATGTQKVRSDIGNISNKLDKVEEKLDRHIEAHVSWTFTTTSQPAPRPLDRTHINTAIEGVDNSQWD